MREVKHLIPMASRAELIAKARERVERKQIESQADLDEVRSIVGYSAGILSNERPSAQSMEEQLIAIRREGKRTWAKPIPEIAERAKYRCEYCDLDFLASLENYKLWQVDHIVSLNLGGSEGLANLALACRRCNCDSKGRWNPECCD
jgi:5-methylcytosine-specific restriction endonuclease McrA